jgi:hypothetical protein
MIIAPHRISVLSLAKIAAIIVVISPSDNVEKKICAKSLQTTIFTERKPVTTSVKPTLA